MDAQTYAVVDPSGLVLNVVYGRCDAPPGCTLVPAGPGAEPGGSYANGVFARAPSSAPTATGNQWAFALKACKAASSWRAACAKASDADQIRLDLISRSAPLQLDDPLLVRVAALATPPIDVPTVMACAQGMPL